MNRLQKFEPILWVVISLCLGHIISTGLSYAVVQINPVKKDIAIGLFNEAMQSVDANDGEVTEVIISTQSRCQPVFKNTIEKQCVQDIAVVFSNGSVLYGTCSTWSFKEFSCEVFQKRPPLINQDYGDRA